jgi:hypothetical protein
VVAVISRTGISRQQPTAVAAGALDQQHPAEREPVVRGPAQPAVAQRERRPGTPLPIRPVGQFQPAGGAPFGGNGEPVALGGRNLEPGIHHSRRPEHPLGQELRQRLAGREPAQLSWRM